MLFPVKKMMIVAALVVWWSIIMVVIVCKQRGYRFCPHLSKFCIPLLFVVVPLGFSSDVQSETRSLMSWHETTQRDIVS